MIIYVEQHESNQYFFRRDSTMRIRDENGKLKSLRIGDLIAKVPIIQGGMGVGVSLSRLAGAVAKEGGIGIISTAQIGYQEEGFRKDPIETNLMAIKKHIAEAKRIGEGGIVGVNVMVATKGYEKYIVAACEGGADVIISGAGLPINLPDLVKGFQTKIAPIVSSLKAATVILKIWDKKSSATADFIVIEGPRAGGHLGFNKEEIEQYEASVFAEEVKKIIEYKKPYELKYQREIPVILGGGIYDRKDIEEALELGCDGVQIGTRFVATEECDASLPYKMAYVNAKKEDIQIVSSPVGLPGRAIRNGFIQRMEQEKEKIVGCYQCLSHCNPKEIPYCISKALIKAVSGNTEEGLIFCGDNAYRITEITTVAQLMQELD